MCPSSRSIDKAKEWESQRRALSRLPSANKLLLLCSAKLIAQTSVIATVMPLVAVILAELFIEMVSIVQYESKGERTKFAPRFGTDAAIEDDAIIPLE